MVKYVLDAFSSYFAQGWHMSPVFLILFVGIILQATKVIIDFVKYKKIYVDNFFSSGGFPSFHTGLASSVTMIVLMEYGFDSILFAVAFAFSLLVAYDAMNLRYEAGQHAHYINDMRFELQSVLQKSAKRPLKERIGHTPLEVFGGMLFGSLLTFLLYYWIYVN